MSEPFRIQLTARAARDLQRLPEKIATACVEFIFGPLAGNPARVGKPLRGSLPACDLLAAATTESSTRSSKTNAA